ACCVLFGGLERPPLLTLREALLRSPRFGPCQRRFGVFLGVTKVPRLESELTRYLAELLAERHKLNPFVPVLPHSIRLLNQEILRVSTLLENASLLNQSGFEHGSPLTSGGLYSNGAATDMNGWTSAFQSESSSAYSWLGGSQGSSSGLIVKKTMRVDIPVDKYPTYNFVGRILGPRGNSLKRVEATTDCRVLIRGRGSIKDPAREEMMRGKPGYEHLNEPLHILVEAELPVEIIDARLMQAREILEDLLRPMVCFYIDISSI
uniref:K Homology domain-containing protein n=3 Tax=Aegilops tauschii subsp. strangulata TaxID=200361 RepID=A0A453PG45_AEGTS